MGPANECGAIREYHAHVFFDNVSRERAADLRAQVEARFPVQVYPWRSTDRTTPFPAVSNRVQTRPVSRVRAISDDEPERIDGAGTSTDRPSARRPYLNAVWMGEVLPINFASLRELETLG
jgi:aromatic ring-cleaving dioxygenase